MSAMECGAKYSVKEEEWIQFIHNGAISEMVATRHPMLLMLGKKCCGLITLVNEFMSGKVLL